MVMIKRTLIVEKTKLKLKNGYLLVGLPGIGLIGKTVVDYLVKELGAKKVADIYSHYFPHQVFMTKSGILRPIRNSFYHIKAGKNDLVFLTGDVQALTSTGQYEIACRVVDYAKSIGVSTILSIGGYGSGKVEGKKEIFGLVTHKEMIPELQKQGIIFGKARGSIIGAAGLIPTFAKPAGLKGLCVLGETHGAYVDPTMAKEVVVLLSKYLSFNIDLGQLDKKAKEGEKIIKQIEEEIKKASGVQQPADFGNRDVSYIR